MKLIRFEQPSEFYARAAPFLLAREADHNLIFGLCADLMQQVAYGDRPPYLAVVEQGQDVVAAALMTPPRSLILSHVADPGALGRLAHDLAAVYPTLPGVSGPAPVSKAFAEQWQALSGQRYHLGMAMRIYQLTAVRPVSGVSGRPRRATPADRELLRDWIGGFSRDTGDELPPGELERSVERWLNPELRTMYLWLDGQPVAMAGSSGPTPHGIRVGAVYTPPEQRRKGYASACVAALSQDLLDSGRRFVFLFTDLRNPTSNHIYQEIGYAPVCDVDEYRFAAP